MAPRLGVSNISLTQTSEQNYRIFYIKNNLLAYKLRHCDRSGNLNSGPMVEKSDLKAREKQQHFYRAMHFSAKRGIAIACRLSVCLSVCNVGEL